MEKYKVLVEATKTLVGEFSSLQEAKDFAMRMVKNTKCALVVNDSNDNQVTKIEVILG